RYVEGLDIRQLPVESVTWKEATDFCKRLSLSAKEKKSGRTYRLPTEAEWEYSCRGGAFSRTAFHFGHTMKPEHGNFLASKLGRTCDVGSYPPNIFGLYNMHGNVWEWCSDWYDPDYYSKRPNPDADPQGPARGA